MSGKRITEAINSLVFFLKSLPRDSFFNVVSFGSNYEIMYQKSLANST